MIEKQNFDFLKQLKENNNREWFLDNKNLYTKAHQNTIDFADLMIKLMNEHDVIENENGKKSLFRIYKDVRFSKDKSPYKTHWGMFFKRSGENRRGGYYFHLEPGNCFAGGGFWQPNKEDLALIRSHIDANADPLREVINQKPFTTFFDGLHGEQLKKAPKGFPIDHPDIDLLRYKGFITSRKFSDKEVMASDFGTELNNTFLALRPFFDVMTEYLTTDLNGLSLI